MTKTPRVRDAMQFSENLRNSLGFKPSASPAEKQLQSFYGLFLRSGKILVQNGGML
jgi:hypothetical protein